MASIWAGDGSGDMASGYGLKPGKGKPGTTGRFPEVGVDLAPCYALYRVPNAILSTKWSVQHPYAHYAYM